MFIDSQLTVIALQSAQAALQQISYQTSKWAMSWQQFYRSLFVSFLFLVFFLHVYLVIRFA